MYLINIIVSFNLKRNWILLFADITNFDYGFMSCLNLVMFILASCANNRENFKLKDFEMPYFLAL